MKPEQKYILETLAYGFVVLLGLTSLLYSSLTKKYFLVLISLLIIYVSIDNFFCGTRLEKTCNVKVKYHYIIPPFLRKR